MKGIVELEKALRESEDTGKTISGFLASKSMEMQTSVDAILAIVDTQIRTGELTEATKQAFDDIYKSGNTLTGIISSISDLPELIESQWYEKAAKQSKNKPVRSPLSRTKIKQSPVMRKLLINDAQKTIDTLGELYPKICRSDMSVSDISDKTMESYIISVHGMKGALANIGETDMSSAAFRLELAGKDHDFDVIADETPAFIETLKSLICDLSSAEDANSTQEAPADVAGVPDMTDLRAKLHEIKTACEAYNIAIARPILDELMQKTWSKQVSDIIEQLNMNLLHSDFEQAVVTTDKCLDIVK